MSKLIAVCADDLLFLSKIQHVAKSLQMEIRSIIGVQDEMVSRISELAPSSILIDLNSKKIDAIGLIRSLKSSAGTAAILSIGFFSHVDMETHNAAVSAGCDHVLPRSVFIQKLPEILSIA